MTSGAYVMHLYTPDLVCFSSEFFCIACRLHADINTSGSQCSTGVLKNPMKSEFVVCSPVYMFDPNHSQNVLLVYIYLKCTVFVLDKLRRISISHVALYRFVSNQTQVACHGILMIKGKDKWSFDVPFLDVPPSVSVSITKKFNKRNKT